MQTITTTKPVLSVGDIFQLPDDRSPLIKFWHWLVRRDYQNRFVVTAVTTSGVAFVEKSTGWN